MARQLVGDTPEARRLWLESLDAVGRMAAFRAVDPEQQRKWALCRRSPRRRRRSSNYESCPRSRGWLRREEWGLGEDSLA
jgi:hypothetical protein